MKKIIFIANYAHLNIGAYDAIVTDLKGEIEPYLMDLGNNSNAAPSKTYKHYSEIKARFKQINPHLRGIKHNTIFDKILSIPAAIENYLKLAKILEEIKPDVIILESDLGNLNVRFLIDNIDSVLTKTIILYLCDVPPKVANRNMTFLSSILSKKKLKLIKFIRALIFKGEIVGSFAIDADIFVIAEEIKNKLIKCGVMAQRLNLYDYGFNKPALERLDSATLKIPEDCYIVAFYTECLQEIYGIEYIQMLYRELTQIFTSNLNSGLYLIIKPHPLENEKMLRFMQEIFVGSNIKFIRDIDSNALINFVDLNVAHYSRILIDACIANKNILSINIKNDGTRTFLQDVEKDMLEVKSIDQLEMHIFNLKDNAFYRNSQMDRVFNVAIRFMNNGINENLYNRILFD